MFSNGKPVMASDFTYTVERAIKIPWGGSASSSRPNIVGATAYATGKAKTISGITTNDATGKIVIHLIAPYGAFDNVLAFPSLGHHPDRHADEGRAEQPAARRRAVHDHEHRPQPVVLASVKNPHWAAMDIPGIPAGHVNVNVKIDSNVDAERAVGAQQHAPTSSTGRTRSPAACCRRSSRRRRAAIKLVDLGGSTYYIFLNTQSQAVQQPARP